MSILINLIVYLNFQKVREWNFRNDKNLKLKKKKNEKYEN